jgi:hypothetical protein
MLLLFPFLPQSFTLPIAALVGVASFVRPRVGLALALAVPVLPLGDVSIGLAIAYAAAAALWFQIWWRQARAGAAFVLGPVLAAVGLLALVAFGADRVRGAPRRALLVLGSLAAAVSFAALRGSSLPFVGAPPPTGLGITRSESPTAVVTALASYAWSQPALLLLAGILGLIAVASPLARRASVWQLSLAGSTVVAAMLLAPTLAMNVDVRPGEIVVASALGLGFLARPALAAARQAAPSGEQTRAARLVRALTRRIPRPSAPRIGGARRAESAPHSTAAAELGPIVTDPVSLEEAWTRLIETPE